MNGEIQMKITLKKISNSKWNVMANGESVGDATMVSAYGGSYEITLPNRITINATSQKRLKEMVASNL